jgi:hypothetical protein
MTLGQLAPIVIGTAVQVGFHYVLWRRLVRDPGWSARARRAPPRRSCCSACRRRRRSGSTAPTWRGSGRPGWVAFPWMALVAITVCVLGALDLGQLAWAGWRQSGAARRRGRGPRDPSRRRALARMTGGAAVVASTATVAAGCAPRWATEVTTVGRDPRPRPALRRVRDRAAHRSARRHDDRDYVARVVAQVNAIVADVIAVTGDMVDG